MVTEPEARRIVPVHIYVQHHLSLAKPFLFSLAAGVWFPTSAVA
jgi:hypothetical protein